MSAQDNLGPQWWHGTRADLKPGDMIEPGHPKVWPQSHSTKVYFGDKETASYFAPGDTFANKDPIGDAKVYPVEPTGRHWKNDIGEMYKDARASRSPLRVIGPGEPRGDTWLTKMKMPSRLRAEKEDK